HRKAPGLHRPGSAGERTGMRRGGRGREGSGDRGQRASGIGENGVGFIVNDDIQHARLMELLEEFRNFSKEPEYVEFKHNRADADEIGEYIAALSNAAVLADKSH